MRVLILGSGLMGPAAAIHALSDPQVATVTLADRSPGELRAVRKRHAVLAESPKFATAVLDAADLRAAVQAMVDHDVVVAALPRSVSAAAVRAAAKAGTPLVDLTRPPESEVPELCKEVRERGGLAIIGCGLDPGLSEIMARYLAGQLDRVDELHGRCGGLPAKPVPPLGYKIVFGGRQLPLREPDALVLENGQFKEVPRYSGVETVSFPAVGELEAYHEGFPPWLMDLPEFKGLRQGSQKTLRWPGYAAKASLLKEIGLLGQAPIEVGGARVVPKQLLDALLARRLQFRKGESDITLFRVEAIGARAGRRCRYRVEMVDHSDVRQGLTSMARVTAFTAAIVARMIARGEIQGTGLFSPEQLITGPAFDRLVAELAALGVRFDLTTEAGGTAQSVPNWIP